MHEQLNRLGWFLPLRLATFIIIAVVVFWIGLPHGLATLFVAYAVLTAAMTIFVATSLGDRWALLGGGLLALQFLAEVTVDTVVIYATGTMNSPFSGLFILTIVSAALAYRLIGTLAMASLASLAYTFIVWIGLSLDGHPEIVGSNLRSVISAEDPVFYSIFLHILIFYLIAFISGYLAERLRQRDRQLADTSRALQKAQLETDDILTHLNSGLLTIDAAGRIIFFNRAAERILGYREAEVKGLSCQDAFADRMPRLVGLLIEALHGRHAHPRHEISIRPDRNSDRTMPLGLSTSCLTEPDGSVRGVIAIFSDLTEAKRLEAKVRAADRLAAIGELSASIAHEIRNPLATISGSVEVLRADLQLGGQDARLMDLIIRESDRLSKITTEFLTYARVTEPNLAKVELCHLVGEVIQLLKHHASYRPDHVVELHTDESIVYVVGDEDLIKQMLLNLGVNALEAIGPNPGHVTFRLALVAETGDVELRVEDTGPGIPEEDLRRIYQPFFSTKKQGTGLGLAIVHRMAQAMRLGLRVHTNRTGGAVFRIVFLGYGRTADPSIEAAEAGAALSSVCVHD